MVLGGVREAAEVYEPEPALVGWGWVDGMVVDTSGRGVVSSLLVTGLGDTWVVISVCTATRGLAVADSEATDELRAVCWGVNEKAS